MNIELLMTGLKLMIIGMGTVYLFIIIMIYCMQIMSKIIKLINKYFPEVIEDKNKTKKKIKQDDTEIAIAIALAMKERGL